MSIHIRKPIIEMETRLCDIPTDWLVHVEPKIIRGSFLPCWIWTGGTDSNGYPVIRDPYTGKLMMGRRFVARMFWDFPKKVWCSMTCENLNCLYPGHIRVSTVHPRWEREDA